MQGHASPVGTVLSVEFSSQGQVSWKARKKTGIKKHTNIVTFHFHTKIHTVAAASIKSSLCFIYIALYNRTFSFPWA